VLAGKILLFSWIWVREIRPKYVGVADFFDTRMDAPSAALQVEIATPAFEALRSLPDGQIIWKGPVATFAAGAATVAAATMLLKADPNGSQVGGVTREAAAAVVVDAAERGAQVDEELLARARTLRVAAEQLGLTAPPPEPSAASLLAVSSPPERVVGDTLAAARKAGIEDVFATAEASLETVKSLLSQVNLRYVELAGGIAGGALGVGVAVPFADAQYSVLSVMGGGNEAQLYITCGVLRDVRHERATALELCNKLVRNSPAYPIFLHEAEVGWDILISNVFSIRALAADPQFLADSVRGLPVVADAVRPRFSEAGLGGAPFQWNDKDLRRVFLESML
jgi:hypothetical protein